MINFRYHVVSIIGIFIALAVGVVLGAGPLQSRIQAGVSTSSSTAATDPQLSAQADAEAAGLKALASSALSGSLAGAKVALVVLPGASDDDVSARGRRGTRQRESSIDSCKSRADRVNSRHNGAARAHLAHHRLARRGVAHENARGRTDSLSQADPRVRVRCRAFSWAMPRRARRW